MKRTLTAVLTIGVLVSLIGCSGGSEPIASASADRRIALEKENTQAFVNSIYSAVPRDLIAAKRQMPSGSLVSCASGDQWAGHGEMKIADGKTVRQVFDALRSSGSFQDWRLELDTNGEGEPRLSFLGAEGSAVLLSSFDDGTKLQVNSFSRCMVFADDFIPGGSY
ncbi:hypothetical protein [Curtobacterium sp. B8]|uniref:hypothetical protein n=1 Tax=Curtobacterium sp. B8 TaxID=95611 RepID=UPI0011D186F1|nr:hypothetical protein [Curtobacterium sp. B8]